MFNISKRTEQGFDLIILSDDEANTAAEVIPSCGAILHAFERLHHNETINVIDSYDNIMDYTENLTAKGFKGAKLSPFVCRIKNAEYSFEDKRYRADKFLLGENAIHGLLFDAVFEVIEEKITSQSAVVTMRHRYRSENAGYPFGYDCIITYTLHAQSKLTVTTQVKNKTERSIPIQDGWHPYFSLGEKIDELQLEFQSKEKLEFDNNMIPTGKLNRYEEFGSLKRIDSKRFDDCFTVNFAECQPMCVLRHPIKRIQVEIFPDRSYPYLQIYTPDHRNSIAIENLSGAPDAFNNGMGLITLNKGESITFETSYKITSLHPVA